MERPENVRTSQKATEIRRYNLAVLGISEIHWTQAGQRRLDTGEMLLYSGHEEKNAPLTHSHRELLSKEARNAFIGWESYGSRTIKTSFRTKKRIMMNVIQCYAPTNNDNKDHFYETAIDPGKVPKKGSHHLDERPKRQSRNEQYRI
ncbi:unnamed protein product [Schistosoma margrebowiei]|uniref:Uncharacterized protein n=1 Tax=Schistosoma margrebowiei TaxID=48269 RepID=A0A183N5W3_9TREM|nr:unnamed protein product [Schistosoma margrebowiei]